MVHIDSNEEDDNTSFVSNSNSKADKDDDGFAVEGNDIEEVVTAVDDNDDTKPPGSDVAVSKKTCHISLL
eukprot:4511238-Ditylum_brightwellii.AAC.1